MLNICIEASVKILIYIKNSLLLNEFHLYYGVLDNVISRNPFGLPIFHEIYWFAAI